MLRVLGWILLAIVLICVIAGLVLWSVRVPLFETLLSKQLNCEVKVDNLNLGWSGATIKSLRIQNPRSSTLPYAFTASDITVRATPTDLMKDKVYINQVNIQDPHITIELETTPQGIDNNWLRLFKKAPKAKESTTPERTFVIEQLTIDNLNVDLQRNKNDQPITLPTISHLEFRGLGKGESFSLGKIIKELLIKVIEAIEKENHLNLGSLLLEEATSLSEKALKKAETKSMEKMKEKMQEGADAVKRKTEEAQEYLQNLFSK